MKKTVRISLCLLIILALVLCGCAGMPAQESAAPEETLPLDEATDAVSLDKAEMDTAIVLPEADLSEVVSGEEQNGAFNDTPYMDSYTPAEINFNHAGTDMKVNSLTLNGDVFNGKDEFAKAKLTVFTVWSTTCPACISTIPAWAELSDEYAGSGVNFVGLCTDAQESSPDVIETAKQILADKKANYPQIIVNSEVGQKILMNMMYIPTTFFIGSDGNTLCSEMIGYTEKDGLVNVIESIISTME